MKGISKRVALLCGGGSGLFFGTAMFAISLFEESSRPLLVRVLVFAGAGLLFGILIGIVVYRGQLLPWSNDPPPPGFADRQVTFRDRMLGDGRPFPKKLRRSNYVWGAVSVGMGVLFTVLGVATGALWPTFAVGLLMLTVGGLNVVIARHRRVPRPPYSTWLEQQGASQERKP